MAGRGVRLEAPYYADIDAEEQGVLSSQYPHLHTVEAPEPNVTQRTRSST